MQIYLCDNPVGCAFKVLVGTLLPVKRHIYFDREFMEL